MIHAHDPVNGDEHGDPKRLPRPRLLIEDFAEQEQYVNGRSTVELNQVTLPSTDLERSVRFYRRLGFRQIVDAPGYARFECRPGGPSFSLHAVEERIGTCDFMVYFECDDVDAEVARLRQLGIEIAEGPTDRRWLWREARLRDPDGNRICLYHAGDARLHPPWRLPDDREG